MELNELHCPAGSRQSRKRRGRGLGSGLGKTGGRGTKGQNSRSGGGTRAGFEGGQMPLHRRLPRRGFKNFFRVEYVTVNVGVLAELGVAEIDAAVLMERGLISEIGRGLKILGDGEVNTALVVRAHAFSEGARKKIEAAQGRAEVVSLG